jgi:hypothetical protein
MENSTVLLHEIIIICPQCKSQNTLMLDEENKSYLCTSCKTELIKGHRVIRGFLYILSNEAMPGLLKIGYSMRAIDERVRELNSPTSVPTPFFLEAYFGSESPRFAEMAAHTALKEYKVKGKEFFRLAPASAIRIIGEVLGCRPSYLCEYLSLESK